MTKLERVYALRGDTAIHYNCCQSLLIPFAEECGMDEATACRLGAHFGGGMRMGSVCGAVTGALMVLGGAGCDDEARKTLVHEFQCKNGCLDCAGLLKQAVARGEERKAHCDRMIDDCVELLERLVK